MSSLTRAFCNNKKLNQVLKNTRELVSATSQIIAYSLVFSHLSFIPYVHAGPTGGNVVGGSGTINHSGLTTNINQLTSAMAIDWNSYNVNANEIVNYIQPNASSISLNRILSNSASQIHGQINANGQVVLVNTNGIFFSPTASVNVGGLIASGLNIDPVDFMNGEYVFSSIDSDSGAIINSGILNASLGGSISLLGKQVTNNGLISANLGAVNLAAGKEAVLTFDNQGLMGVKITREILQDELGVDPAVLNNGEITAEGGRVLLTASQSQDVFSQAVNSNGIEQATSVVVNEDGSFTLGAGADVVNTGAVDVSTTDGNAGKIAMLGENVTSSGNVKADSINENGGEIELHATDTTLLTENSTTTARSENNGQGGQVKVLGDKVGLFDQSTVDVSGANGGGQALIGGDFQGKNDTIRNATSTFVSRDSQLFADALVSGNGGKLINWADNSTWFYGDAFSRGGALTGDGGLVEVSGKIFLKYRGNVNTRATNGNTGLLLLDPDNITILNGSGESDTDASPDGTNTFGPTTIGLLLKDETVISTLYESELEGIANDTRLTLEANDNITINELTTDHVLNLQADGWAVNESNGLGIVTFKADADGDGNGTFEMKGLTAGSEDTIRTDGGAVIISGATVIVGKINTTATKANQAGGEIKITASNNGASSTIDAVSLTSAPGPVNDDKDGRNGGSITLSATGTVTVTGAIVATGGNARDDDNNDGKDGGDGGVVSITSTANSISVQGINTNGGNAVGRDAKDGDGGNAGNILLSATSGNISIGAITANGGTGIDGSVDKLGGDAGSISFAANNITLNNSISSQAGQLLNQSANVVSGGEGLSENITFTGAVILANDITITTSGNDVNPNKGNITFTDNINSNAAGTHKLTLTTDADNIDVDGAIGTGIDGRLAALNITSANDITLGTVAVSGGVTAESVTVSQSNSFTTNNYLINTTGAANTAGGAVSVESSGLIAVGAITADGGTANADSTGLAGGDITLDSSTSGVTINGTIKSNGSAENGAGTDGGDGGVISLAATSGTININGDIFSKGGAATNGAVGNYNSITINAQDVSTTSANARAIEGGLINITSSNAITLGNSLALTANKAGSLALTNKNDVLLNADINYNGIGAGKSLIIKADDDIAVDGIADSVLGADQLAVELQADFDNGGTGGRIEIVNNITTGGGSFTANANTFLDWTATSSSGIAGDINTGGGFVDIDSVSDFIQSRNISSNNGLIEIDVTSGYFNNASVDGVISSGIGNIVITSNGVNNGTDKIGVNLGHVNTSTGQLIIDTSTGDGTIHQDDFAYIVNVGGQTTLNAGLGNIELNNANASVDFNGDVLLTAATTASISDINSIQLGASTITNGLTIAAESGNITQVNTLDITGIASFTSTDGYIYLPNNNNFKGDVSLTTSGTDLSSTDVEITDNDDISIVNANIGIADSGLKINATTINLDGNILTNGGAATFNGPVVLQSLTESSINTGVGAINFNGTLNGTNLREQSLALTAGNVNFGTAVIDGTVGGTTRLGNLSVNASGTVNAYTSSLTVNSLTVSNSTAFTADGIDTQGDEAYLLNEDKNALTAAGNSGAVVVNSTGAINVGDIVTTGAQSTINQAGYSGGNVTLNTTGQLNVASITTQGGNPTAVDSRGFNGGNVDLDGADIVIGAITTNGTSAQGAGTNDAGSAGTVSIDATDNSVSGTPTITLDGDINTETGTRTGVGGLPTAVVAQLKLLGASNPNGMVKITHPTDFMSAINIAGVLTSGGADTLTSSVRDSAINSWSIDTTNTLNGNVTFSNFERLIGGDTVSDTFTIASGTFDGLIDGGTGGVAYIDIINLPAVATTVQLSETVVNIGNGILETNNIEQINANAGVINTLYGPGAGTDWYIDEPSGVDIVKGSLGGTGLTMSPIEGEVMFSNFTVLNGGIGADTFNILSGNIAPKIVIDGGSSLSLPTPSDGYDKIVGPNIDTTWTIDSPNGGTIVDSDGTLDLLTNLDVEFSDIENLTSGSGDDSFEFIGTNDVQGTVDAGFGTDDIIVTNFNMSNGLRTSFEEVTGNGTSSTLTGNSTSTNAYTWDITGENSGVIYNSLTDPLIFSGFNNLVGNVGNDTFNFKDDGTAQGQGYIRGLINGGTGGTNTLNIYTPLNLSGGGTGVAVTVQLEGVLNDNLNGFIDVINLSGITANSGFTNVLRGGETLNTWTIDGTQSGSVITRDITATFDTTTDFTNFDSLIGGNAAIDTFKIDNSGVIASISGGASGSVIDEVVNLRTANTTWSIDADGEGSVTGITLFTEINKLTGAADVVDKFNLGVAGSISDSVNGGTGAAIDEIINLQTTGTTIWDITGAGQGNVAGITLFTEINKLTGAADVIDKFNLAEGGSISGSVNGGTGTILDEIINQRTSETNWNITDINEGSLEGITSFIGIEKLTGSSGVDNFILSGGTLSGTIDGAGGTSDKLTGDNVTNTWVITGANQGNLNGVDEANTETLYDFINIENLTGNAQDDEFTFNLSSSLSGTIDGAGEQVEDIVDMRALADPLTIKIGPNEDLINIEKIIGNNNGTETGISATLTGIDLDNEWIIFDVGDATINFTQNQGTVTDINGDKVTFIGFNNITGGNQDDRFTLQIGGEITGVIDGGVGDGIDTINLSAQAIVDETVVNTASDQPGFANIDGITGNGTDSILRAGNNGSTWTITGNNEGFVKNNDGTQTTFFFDFNILQGGDGQDVFTVNALGSIGNQSAEDLVSRINGGQGDDKLTITLSGTNSQIIRLFDGDGATVIAKDINNDDIISFIPVVTAGLNNEVVIESLNINTGFETENYTTNFTSGQRITHDYSNSLSPVAALVSYYNVQSVNDNVAVNNLIVNGRHENNTVANTVILSDSSGGAGDFIIKNGPVDATNATENRVFYQNKGGLSIQNLGAISHIELLGGLNFTGIDSLIDFTATAINLQNTGSVLSANKLRLNSVDAINTSDASSRLLTNVAELELNNITTNLFIQEANALGLRQIDTTAVLDISINLNGNITDLANLSSTGSLNFTTSAGDIILDNANTLSGSIGLTTGAGRTATLNNLSTTILGTVSVGNLNVSSSGELRDGGGSVVVTERTVLNQGSSSITLDNDNNDFNVVEINTNASVEIKDMNNIVFDNVSLGLGSFTVNAVGVSQVTDKAITQTTSGAAGDVIINAGLGVIDLSNQNNEFVGNVRLSNSGKNNVTIADISEIIFGNTSIGSGDFTVNSAAILQQAGSSIVQTLGAGNVVLNASEGEINLSEAANDFIGTVSFNSAVDKNVDITDMNRIILGESSVGGNLTVTAIGDNIPGNERFLGDFETGDIEQDNSGAGITVAGASKFRVSDSRSIILSNPDNNFNSIAFELTGGVGILDSVILSNNSSIDLGDINLGGHLGLLANGDITNTSGIVEVARTAWIEASNSGVFNRDPATSGATQFYDVQLTNAENNFKDIVINAANNVDIVSLSDINFGDSANLQFSGEPLRNISTIYGNLSVTSAGNIGNITGMRLTVAGDSQFDATTGSVVLDEIVNLNSVAFNAQDVTLVNQDAIDLAASNISNTAIFTAETGNITNSGDLEILGNAQFNASANSDILITNILTGNRLQGELSFVPDSGSLNSVIIENTRATNLATVNSNSLVINSQGAITDTLTATISANTANLTAGNQDIILDGENNDFNNLTVVSASELQVNDINSLVIEGVNASALTTVVSENNLTVDGAINAGLGVNLTANNGFVLLENTVHTNTGDIGISGNQITQNALIDGGTNISLISSSDINQNADIEGNGSGEISLIANNGGITMAADTISSNNSIAYTTINAGNNASAILANLTANDLIDINVAGNLTQTGDFTSATGNINIVAGSYVMDTDTITSANAGSVTAEIEGLVDVQSITADRDLNLTSNTQSVQLNEALVSTQGGVNVSAAQAVTAVDITSETGINLSSTNGSISQNGNFTSEQGVIELNSGQGINMAANTSTSSTLGDIQYNAVNDVIVTSLTANGVAGINTSAGEIIDANEDALNFIATTLSLRAANGIGSTERLESQVSIMDVENSTSGKVDIIQTGEVELVALKNTGSDGDVTLFTDMDINFNPGSVIANRENGELFMTTQTGSFLGLGEGTLTNPDITAQNAVFFGRAGTFGTIERPLTLDVPGSVLIDTKTSFFPRFVPPGPATLDTRGIDFTLIGAISAVAGEQLVEIESLGDIDPAIFTELQNYNQEDVAIRMPRDQLFEDELEEYDRQ